MTTTPSAAATRSAARPDDDVTLRSATASD